jgi:hypothetical protein
MRLLHFSLLLIFLFAYGLVKIPGAIQILRNHSNWRIRPYWPDLYKYGDLYRFSFLKEYKESSPHCLPPPAKPETRTDLFVLGDSFAAPFGKLNFPGVRNFSFVNWNQFDGFKVKLKTDSSVRNVLIIESSEKHILLRFSKGQVKRFMPLLSDTGKPGFQLHEKEKDFAGTLEKYAGRPAVADQNLNILLFSNEAILRIKETKADFNRSVFGRIAAEVEEYPAKNMLLQRMTTDLDYLYMSSFRPITSSRENETFLGMKRLQAHFRKAGIDTVIFACIPNPVSVIAANYKGRTYNQLIPRLETQMKASKTGLVSVFSEFSQLKEKVYRRGDTHWNDKGEAIWQKKANMVLSACLGESLNK